MRLEPMEPWELTAGGAVSTAVPLVLTGVSVSVVLLSGDTAPAVTLGAGLVGLGLGAYVALDWLGRASRLVDEHRRRDAERDPDMMRQREERELIEAKIRLVQAIEQLSGEHLAYARQASNVASLVLDGDRQAAAWRLGGYEFPLHYATAWLVELAKCAKDQLPADMSWSPETGIPREAWRSTASAMAANLSSQGVARRASGPIAPRWTVDDPQQREAALIRTQVLLAAELDKQIRLGE